MAPAGLATTLAGIEIVTDRLAAHNTGEKVLSPAEERILLLELGTLNRNIERCMAPARRQRSNKFEVTYKQVICVLVASVLITGIVIAMGIVLHEIYTSFAMSMAMRPGP